MPTITNDAKCAQCKSNIEFCRCKDGLKHINTLPYDEVKTKSMDKSRIKNQVAECDADRKEVRFYQVIA